MDVHGIRDRIQDLRLDDAVEAGRNDDRGAERPHRVRQRDASIVGHDLVAGAEGARERLAPVARHLGAGGHDPDLHPWLVAQERQQAAGEFVLSDEEDSQSVALR